MDVRVKPGKIEREPAEVLVLTHFEGETRLTDAAAAVDRLLDGRLHDLLKSGEFEGKLNQAVLLHALEKTPAKRVLLVGLGKRKDARVDYVRQAMGTAVKRVRDAGASSFVTCLHGEGLPNTSTVELAQALVEGALLGAYRFTDYLSEKTSQNKRVSRLTILAADTWQVDDLKEGVRRGVATAEAAIFVRDLCNHPSNVMTPARIAAEAKAIGREHHVRVTVLERAHAERLGMGAFLGVARGSHEPPKFIILEYNGKARGKRQEARGARGER